jgi:hypothetical protein
VNAIHGFGENAGRRGFADAARAGEDVGVSDAIFLDGVGESFGYVFLSDEVREGLRAPLPCDHLVGHRCLHFRRANGKSQNSFRRALDNLERGNKSMKHLWLAVMATALVLGLLCSANAQNSPKITGTYSDMRFVPGAGDVIGHELKIVVTRGGYQGALQMAEGAPGRLVVVDIKVGGTKIRFEVPETSPDSGYFEGTIRDGVLRGEFHFKDGGSEKVELKKGKSYWD